MADAANQIPDSIPINLVVNGVRRTLDLVPWTTLLDALRDHLALMAAGHSNAGIASRLVVTEKAVSKHIGNIFTKLDLYPTEDANRRVLACGGCGRAHSQDALRHQLDELRPNL